MIRKTRRNNSGNPGLEMTPMIDVVFQLLIFFIVTLKQEDIFSQMEALRPQPEVNVERPPPIEPLTILVGREGLFFNGALVTENRLHDQLARVARLNPDTSVIIKCDERSLHGMLIRALDVANAVGLRKLSVFSM